MSSKPEEMRDRTKAFALRIIRLFRFLPYRTDTQVLGKQLLRCGTAVAANYRAACRRDREPSSWHELLSSPKKPMSLFFAGAVD
jgi:four helix bundle protein